MIQISLPRPILSRNQLDKLHWGARSRESKAWELDIWAMLGGRIPKANGPMRVIVTSTRQRLLDDDNLAAGFKGGRDAMKRLGLIVEDSPKWVKFEYRQRVHRACIGTVIEFGPLTVPEEKESPTDMEKPGSSSSQEVSSDSRR